MRVVRREADWRLEKIREGVYDVTFRAEPQVRAITPEAVTDEHAPPLRGPAPVRHVDSSPAAEDLFEERCHGPPPVGSGRSPGGHETGGGSPDDTDTAIRVNEVPPLGLGALFVLSGAFLVVGFWDQHNRLVLSIGLAFIAAGLVPLLYACYRFSSRSPE